jgi:hypothetical protein
VGLNKNPTGPQSKPEKKPAFGCFVSCVALIKHHLAIHRIYKFPQRL